jgi:peptide/nickel transport system substrate-binding protein
MLYKACRMTLRRLLLSLAMLAAGAGLLGAAVTQSGANASPVIRDGGTFNVSFGVTIFDYVDPALSYTAAGWALLDPTCARLMNYPDKPPPAGLRIVPEVAAGYPRISSDAKTYTFTLREGFRFSDGTPVQADAFARAINRTLAPGVKSPGTQYTGAIVGAGAVQAGKSTAATGVVARGNRLVIRFTRPVPDFPAQTTMPFFCAVPPTLPSDPEGVGAFPGAGPYYISEYVRGQRVVLERNRFYTGTRPHHIDRFVVDLRARTPEAILDRIERGGADWGLAPQPFYFDPARGLARKYGVNRSRFFVRPGLSLRGYLLNTARPLFRNNVKLRRAVNFALDRPAIVRRGGKAASISGHPTDQYMPPGMPGFNDAHIYPLTGPDLRKARALARGQTRSGKAVLYTIDVPPELVPAQIVKRNLRSIGLDVEVKALPPQAYFSRLAGLPFDLAFISWFADYVDPYQFANVLFDGRFIGVTNFTRFNLRGYNQLMRRVARLQGAARYRAYGRLDVQLARDAAPMAAVAFDNEATLVSKRVGCIVLRPSLDLTAACLE